MHKLLTAKEQNASTFKNGYNKYARFHRIHKGERQTQIAIVDSCDKPERLHI
jgi:hypothetical protein